MSEDSPKSSIWVYWCCAWPERERVQFFRLYRLIPAVLTPLAQFIWKRPAQASLSDLWMALLIIVAVYLGLFLIESGWRFVVLTPPKIHEEQTRIIGDLHGQISVYQSAPEVLLKESDPAIYVDVQSHRIQGTRRTPLTLHNRGKSVAHKIQVNPLSLSVGTATFTEIDTLNVDQKCEALPTVDLAGPGFQNDLVNFLHHEANAKGKGSAKEFVTEASLTYQDVNGRRKFKVLFELMYSPFSKMMYENSGHVATILEVRNTRIFVSN